MFITDEELLDDEEEFDESWELNNLSLRRIGVSQMWDIWLDEEDDDELGGKLGMIWSSGEGEVDNGGDAAAEVGEQDEEEEVFNRNMSEWML